MLTKEELDSKLTAHRPAVEERLARERAVAEEKLQHAREARQRRIEEVLREIVPRTAENVILDAVAEASVTHAHRVIVWIRRFQLDDLCSREDWNKILRTPLRELIAGETRHASCVDLIASHLTPDFRVVVRQEQIVMGEPVFVSVTISWGALETCCDCWSWCCDWVWCSNYWCFMHCCCGPSYQGEA